MRPWRGHEHQSATLRRNSGRAKGGEIWVQGSRREAKRLYPLTTASVKALAPAVVLAVLVGTLALAGLSAERAFASDGGLLQMIGTRRADVIEGTGHAEEISGLGGGDRLHGRGGQDVVLGGPGSDELGDGLGRDTVRGGSGRHTLIGQGFDTARDHFYGGRGDDNLQSRDMPAVEDVVNCGTGNDTVYADRADFLGPGCERKKVW
jgi:hypothetical protein